MSPICIRVAPAIAGDAARLLAAANLYFRRPAVITGRSATRAHGERVAAGLPGEVTMAQVEEASLREVRRLLEDVVESRHPDVLVAVGGGRVIDVVKLLSAEKRVPWISMPTAASSDAISSPRASVAVDGGRRGSCTGALPIAVFADLTILAEAPEQLRRAGGGDLLSNITASWDWEYAEQKGRARVDGVARMMALGAARQLLSLPPNLGDPGYQRALVEGLILSGLAMACGTSRPCSGAEHSICHALDAMKVCTTPHGENVWVATLLCHCLQGGDLAQLRGTGECLGLPMSPEELGLDRAVFLEAVRLGATIRPGRWTVLNDPELGSAGAIESAYARAFDAPRRVLSSQPPEAGGGPPRGRGGRGADFNFLGGYPCSA